MSGLFGSSAPQVGTALQQALSWTAPNVLGHLAATAYRDSVPAHVRMFASTLLGDRTPITQGNFSPSELQAMQSLVSNNQTHPFVRKGAVTYGDYVENPQSFQAGSIHDARAHVGPFYGGFDFGNPDITAVGNTVGQFNYHKQPDGSTVINDHYDWGSGRPDGGPQTGRPGLLDGLLAALRTGSLEELGASVAPDKQNGREVHITLPPANGPQPGLLSQLIARTP